MSGPDQFALFLKLLLAVGLGGLVGFEREFRGHEAGIRTSALVCVGAAAFGEVSGLFGDTRIAAGVVQGIGFLGAGLIFRREDSISGVTTAASVWVLAGIGLMVAEDLYVASTLFALAIIGVLELAPVSDWVYRNGRRHAGEPDAPKQTQPEPEGRAKFPR